MFKKLKEAKIQATRREALSIITDGTVIKGDLVMEGELHFDGAIEGNVTARHVTLGEHGKVAGTITADYVEIYGSVLGEIRARTVKLGTSARVNGNITQETITVETGAVLEGRCRRVDDPIEGEPPTEDLLITDKSQEK